MAITATYDPVLSRIRLSATALGATAVTAQFLRSTNGGISYTAVVRGGNSVPVASQNAAADDYEWQPGVATTYLVQGLAANGAAVSIYTATVTQDITSAWLKVPAAPFLNTPVTVVDHGDVTRKSRAGLFPIVGRSKPVMVGDIASSIFYDLQLLTQDAAGESNLDYLFASGEVVFLQLPSTVTNVPGGYFSVGDVSRTPTLRLSPRRVWTVPLTEVAAPGPDVVGSAYTWTSVLADYATWTTLTAANATWSALLARTGSPSDVIVA
ncbi:hypothetical protein GCM10009804_03200 [Kribbella hippodromi]|uniref:Minor tail protein n=1 Tax=Kribbella hippodromi TaxID=434347 RepID=A0ABN2BZ97_9ACTN